MELKDGAVLKETGEAKASPLMGFGEGKVGEAWFSLSRSRSSVPIEYSFRELSLVPCGLRLEADVVCGFLLLTPLFVESAFCFARGAISKVTGSTFSLSSSKNEKGRKRIAPWRATEIRKKNAILFKRQPVLASMGLRGEAKTFLSPSERPV